MKWLLFIKERFHPLSHFPMLLSFVMAHFVFAPELLQTKFLLHLLAIAFLFFLKLRFYDEIKDYAVDQQYNPTRPLVRGLVSHQDLKLGICFCIIGELLLISFLGWTAAIALSFTILYSLLMYKEFFIRDVIRKKLTTYAVSHTFVCLLFSLTLLVTIYQLELLQTEPHHLYFAVANWLLFNVFEFGRKTYLNIEERRDVESYSLIWGKWGASELLLSQALLALICFSQISALDGQLFALSILNAILLIIAIMYAAYHKPPWGLVYRGASSVFIIASYLIIDISIIRTLS